MKILFIGNSRLGDAILSTSILRKYNKKKNKITVICSPLSKDVYLGFKAVTKIIPISKKKYSKHWLEAYLKLDSYTWDLIIDLRNTVISRLLRKKNLFRYKVGYTNLHRVIELHHLIKEKKILGPKVLTSSNIKILAKKTIKQLEINNHTLAIAPFTNWKRKNWPLENYEKLAKKLLISKTLKFNKILLLGSNNEFDQCEVLKDKIKIKGVFNLAGKIDILVIYEIIRKCKLFIGNDSGLTHLSAASGTLTLGLFGPSREQNYSPWGKNSFFIRTPKSYEELVNNKEYNRFDPSSLMTSLSVESVYEKCLEIIR